MDASLGFIFQAEIPLFPKPGKHEQCEVTDSYRSSDRETTLVPKLNQGVRRGAGRTDR